ncbi:MAG: glycosyltransferase family 2 protein [Pseudomonadota bacterium]
MNALPERSVAGNGGQGAARVSVVMPVRNNAETVAQALRSVLAEPEVGEVLFVDDGSTDGSAEIARGLDDDRVRIVPGPQTGVAAAYSTGYAEARLDYVAICDGDDLYRPGRFAWQVGFLDAQPKYVAVVGAYASTDSRLRIYAPLLVDRPEGDVEDVLRAGEPVSTLCAWLVRRRAVVALGGRRTWFEVACDLDYQFRLATLGKVRFVPREAYVYRLREGSVTHANTRARNAFFTAAARDFARQRALRGSDDLADGHPPAFQPPALSAKRQAASAQLAGHLLGHAHRARLAGEGAEALRAALWALRLDPMRGAAWRTAAAVLAERARGGPKG